MPVFSEILSILITVALGIPVISEIEEAFIAISKKIDPDYEDNNNWLEEFFSKNRRSKWSQDEGYVPYIKREKKELRPVSRENKERYPFLD